jgi:hypothetical protein
LLEEGAVGEGVVARDARRGRVRGRLDPAAARAVAAREFLHRTIQSIG